jgi:hypothetical protein
MSEETANVKEHRRDLKEGIAEDKKVRLFDAVKDAFRIL